MGGRIAECPKCHTEIDYLTVWESVTRRMDFDGENYENTDMSDDYGGGDLHFECPECEEELTENEDEAKRILRV